MYFSACFSPFTTSILYITTNHFPKHITLCIISEYSPDFFFKDNLLADGYVMPSGCDLQLKDNKGKLKLPDSHCPLLTVYFCFQVCHLGVNFQDKSMFIQLNYHHKVYDFHTTIKLLWQKCTLAGCSLWWITCLKLDLMLLCAYFHTVLSLIGKITI